MIDNPELAEEIEKKILAAISGNTFVPSSSEEEKEENAETAE